MKVRKRMQIMWVLTYKGEGPETLVEFLSFEHLDLIEASQVADR